MQPNTSLRIARPDPDKKLADRIGKPLTLDEKKDVFKGMVVGSLDAGFLRYSRRQDLLQLAARLGIGEFEASLLIAEAQFCSHDIDPVNADEFGRFVDSPVPVGLSNATRITLALIVAAFADVVLVWWLL